MLDITSAWILLIFFSPFILLIILAIFVLEGRPIFYTSKRLISLDTEESILKFRTMVRDAKSPKYKLEERFMQSGYLDIPLTCEVYTSIGRFLEKTQLVEILQVINIIFHKMSLIGNRPLPRNNIELLRNLPNWEQRFASPAGMTGIAQVVGKFNLSPVDRLDLEKLYSKVYLHGNVLKCDIEIIYFTIRLILTGKNISLDYAISLLSRCL
jgi:lipopolysaccharide/colanic/teichoic acid biosynthesis glycosyltransferase